MRGQSLLARKPETTEDNKDKLSAIDWVGEDTHRAKLVVIGVVISSSARRVGEAINAETFFLLYFGMKLGRFS
jgi:hypothetical protein